MPVKELKVDHLLAFQNLDLSFNDRINVLIGENGSGKTTVLKMIYSATQVSVKTGRQKRYLHDYFRNQNSGFDRYVNRNDGKEEGRYCVSDGTYSYAEKYSVSGAIRDDSAAEWNSLNIPSVYIPAEEMLSHANGFLALNQKYRMPFDATETDIVMNASLPESRQLPSCMNDILTLISKVIDGTVIQENDTFYVFKNDGRKVDFSLEAEGFRKLGLLWKLIRNGLLEKGSVLLWDEPEVNLNPQLYSLVAEILLMLADNGIQIFIATNSYNLSKYLEIRRKEKEEVSFINLDQNVTEHSASRSHDLTDLNPNSIVKADEDLLDEVYEKM